MTRTCNRCLVEFPLSAEYFHRSKGNRGGFGLTCKVCKNELQRDPQRVAHVRRQRQARTGCTPRPALEISILEQASMALGVPNPTKEQIKSWYNREYRKKNKTRINANRRERNKKNPKPPKKRPPLSESDKKKIAEASRKRYAENPLTRLSVFVRNSLNKAIRDQRVPRRGRSHEYLGCSWEELKGHLESQFQPGMNWENRGPRGWHIDHREPLANVKTESDLRRICHFSNLQPMWWRENISKGAKF